MSAPADRLFGWTPFHAALHGESMTVDWCHLGGRRMVEPVFRATIAEAMREPFNLVFQQRTPAEALAGLPRGLPVAGFVFHMPRCGATLVSQALAAFESEVVVSEAAPLRVALRAARTSPDVARVWLEGLVNAYAQPRFSYERRLFVRFVAGDVLDIAPVRRAFPDVPWVFLTRDPAEILASRDVAADLMPGRIEPHLLDLAADAVRTMDPTTYGAQALAAFGRAAIEAHARGGGLVVDHSELPDALWTRICPHFGLSPDPGAVEAMRAVGLDRPERPGAPFSPGQGQNHAGVAALRPVVEPIVGPVMEALARLRAAGPASQSAP